MPSDRFGDEVKELKMDCHVAGPAVSLLRNLEWGGNAVKDDDLCSLWTLPKSFTASR